MAGTMTPAQAKAKLDELRMQRLEDKIGQDEYLQHVDKLAPIAASAEQAAKARKADVLEMYLHWAEIDIATGRRLPAVLVKHLQAYGRRKATFFDRRHAVQIMQQVEDEGIKGEERYEETARRLWRVAWGDPEKQKHMDTAARLIRSWWEQRAEVSEWLDDKRLKRKKGKPKKNARRSTK